MTDAVREYREAGRFTLTSLPKGRESRPARRLPLHPVPLD
jgi:hypothetical protein